MSKTTLLILTRFLNLWLSCSRRIKVTDVFISLVAQTKTLADIYENFGLCSIMLVVLQNISRVQSLLRLPLLFSWSLLLVSLLLFLPPVLFSSQQAEWSLKL